MRLARLICRKDSWKSDARCQSKAGRVGDIDWACGEDEKCLNLPPPPKKCDKEPVLEGVEGSDHGASRRLGRVCAAGPSRLTLERTAAAPGIQ